MTKTCSSPPRRGGYMRYYAVVIMVAAVGLSACSEPAGLVRGGIELTSLRFGVSEAAPGEDLVLMAETRASDTAVMGLDPNALTVQANSLYRVGARLTPVSELSDEELTVAIANAARDIVFIGFKEADALRGVDEHGQVLCSEETEASMKAWLREQGIEITREPVFLPAVLARMPAKLEIVKRVRHHPNVDYLEPNTAGEYSAVSDDAESTTLVGIIPTSSDGPSALRVRTGDTVTATYRQPDGSTLTATTLIH